MAGVATASGEVKRWKSVKEFVEHQRQWTKENKMDERDLVQYMYTPSSDTNIEPNLSLNIRTPSEHCVSITCADGVTLYIPLACACGSGWMRSLFMDGVNFKENSTNHVDFPLFPSEAMELVLQWLIKEFQINGNQRKNSERITFQFPLPPQLVMDVLYLSNYLQVEPLMDSCLWMLTDHLDAVPLDNMPSELLTIILDRCTPYSLCKLESRDDFKRFNLDTTTLWNRHMKKKNWVPDSPYGLTYEKADYLIRFVRDNSSSQLDIKTCYMEKDLQRRTNSMRLRITPEEYTEQLEYLHESDCMKYVKHMCFYYHNILDYPLGNILDKLRNLQFLELSKFPLGNTYKDTASNKCREEILKHLASFLAKATYCNFLKLKECEIRDTSKLVALLQNGSITGLDLKDNAIDGAGIVALAKALPELSNLKELSLYGNPINDAGVEVLMKALPYSSLQVLDLGNTGIADLAGCENLKDAKFLHKLLLSENPLNQTNLELLSTSLPPSLTMLDMYFCSLSNTGSAILCKALEESKTLKAVSLGSNKIKTATSLADMIAKNSTITSLDIGDNMFMNDGGLLIANSLENNHSLLYLDLVRTGQNNTSCEALATKAKASSLKLLCLGQKGTTPEGRETVNSIVTGSNLEIRW